jgi:hypothetical protein
MHFYMLLIQITIPLWSEKIEAQPTEHWLMLKKKSSPLKQLGQMEPNLA